MTEVRAAQAAGATVSDPEPQTTASLYAAASEALGTHNGATTLPGGQSLQTNVTPSLKAPLGQGTWFPAAAGGDILIPGQPLSGNPTIPTATGMSVSAFSPDTNTSTNIAVQTQLIPGATGAGFNDASVLAAKHPYASKLEIPETCAGATDTPTEAADGCRVGGADIEDSLTLPNDSQGRARVAVDVGQPANNMIGGGWPNTGNWKQTGVFPTYTTLVKDNGTWRPEVTRTAEWIHDSNTTIVPGTGKTLGDLACGGWYWGPRLCKTTAEMDLLPRSETVVVAQYNGGFMILGLDGTLKAQMNYPAIVDSNPTATCTTLSVHPREVQASPVSSPGDERFVAIFDAWDCSGHGFFALEEFTYNSQLADPNNPDYRPWAALHATSDPVAAPAQTPRNNPACATTSTHFEYERSHYDQWGNLWAASMSTTCGFYTAGALSVFKPGTLARECPVSENGPSWNPDSRPSCEASGTPWGSKGLAAATPDIPITDSGVATAGRLSQPADIEIQTVNDGYETVIVTSNSGAVLPLSVTKTVDGNLQMAAHTAVDLGLWKLPAGVGHNITKTVVDNNGNLWIPVGGAARPISGKIPQGVQATTWLYRLTIDDLTRNSGFQAVTPTRILDSRTSVGDWNTKLKAQNDRTLKIAGENNIPNGIDAVVLNVTVTEGTEASYLSVYPNGETAPTASNLNFAAYQTIPNLVTVAVGTDGKIAFHNANGDVHVVADLVGYYDKTAAARLAVLPKTTVIDTETNAQEQKLETGETRNVQVAGISDVPATATAVVANISVSHPDAGSYISVWPTGQNQPNASSLNFGPNTRAANLVTVPVGENGRISINNAVGATDIRVDLVGYFDPGAKLGYTRLVPWRAVDNRNGTGMQQLPLKANEARTTTITGRGPVPDNAQAVVLNLTVTNPTKPGGLAIASNGATASTLNIPFEVNQTVPNLSLTALTSGQMRIWNASAGTTDAVADIVGYYTAGS